MARSFLNVPSHIGIIMDGNGRWAQQKGMPRIEGHRRGADRAMEIIRMLPDYGIKNVTLYTFSLENWQRPQKEITMLMKLLERYFRKNMDELVKGGIRFKAVGETWLLPDSIQNLIRQTEERTVDNDVLTLVTALSYGGRNEIIRAVKKAMISGASPEDVTEETFGRWLDTAGVPDPDLIIRTSGEMRVSNFLLWQAAYSEYYFTRVLWPDFDRAELERALDEYERRDRRFGAVRKGEVKGA